MDRNGASKDTEDADLLTIVQMFSDYVNASNVTIINVTAFHATVTDWLEQRQAYRHSSTTIAAAARRKPARGAIVLQ